MAEDLALIDSKKLARRAACARYRAKYPDRRKATWASWYLRNRVKKDAYDAVYRSTHSEQRKVLIAAWRKAHPEALRKYVAKYKAAHPEKVAARVAKWHSDNRDRVNQIELNRKLRMRGNGGSHTLAQWRECLAASNYRCAYCRVPLTMKTATRDHVLPISKGGSNDISNITPSCQSCNSRKSNKVTYG